jgi:hypothetical protein
MVPIAYMPSPIPRQVGWNLFARTIPFASAFPRTLGGSAPASLFSGPAQRSLALRPARSPSRLIATLCTRGFSSLVASTAALIATGWSEPVPGRVYTPAVDQRLHGAPELPVIRPRSVATLGRPACPQATVGLNSGEAELDLPVLLRPVGVGPSLFARERREISQSAALLSRYKNPASSKLRRVESRTRFIASTKLHNTDDGGSESNYS